MYVPNCYLLVASKSGFEMDKRATGCNCWGLQWSPTLQIGIVRSRYFSVGKVLLVNKRFKRTVRGWAMTSLSAANFKTYALGILAFLSLPSTPVVILLESSLPQWAPSFHNKMSCRCLSPLPVPTFKAFLFKLLNYYSQCTGHLSVNNWRHFTERILKVSQQRGSTPPLPPQKLLLIEQFIKVLLFHSIILVEFYSKINVLFQK